MYATPQPRSKKQKSAEPKTAIGWRIFFVVLAVLIWALTLSSYLANTIGDSVKPTNISFSFYNTSGSENNGMKFLWNLYYDYRVDGTEYSGYTVWRGNLNTPDRGSDKYWVNYVPFFPYASTFNRYKSIKNSRDSEDLILGGAITMLTYMASNAIVYLLLFIAFPKIGYFKFKSEIKFNTNKD